VPLVRTPPPAINAEPPDLRVFSSLPAPVSGAATRTRRSVSFALLVLVALLGSMGAGYWIVDSWQSRSERAASAAPTERPGAAETGAPDAAGADDRTGSNADATAAASRNDLSGSWMVTNHIEQSDMSAYKGLTLGFRVELDQNGNRVRGEGMKWLENGRAVAPAARTPITIDGTVEGDRLALTFAERGTRRTSRGSFDMQIAADGSLQGRFSSDAARSSGRAEAVRVTSPPAP
jgi:hypothetical protein